MTTDDCTQTVLDLVLRHAPQPPPPQAGPDTPLTDLGLDSLTVVRVMVEVEAALRVRFPAGMLSTGTFRTAGTIAAAVHELRTGRPAPAVS